MELKLMLQMLGILQAQFIMEEVILSLLEEDLDAYIKYSGLIDSKIEGNNSRLKDLVKQQEGFRVKN